MRKLEPLNEALFFENAIDVLQSFYKAVPDDPGLAFDMLSRQFQYKTYPEGRQRFIDGYGLTTAVTDVEIAFLIKKRNIERYDVSYKEAVTRLSHPLVDQVHQVLHDNPERPVAMIPQAQQFRDMLQDRGGNKKQISQFLDRHFYQSSVLGVNAMVWLSKLPYSDEVLQGFAKEDMVFTDHRTAECLKGKQGYRINHLYYPGRAPALH